MGSVVQMLAGDSPSRRRPTSDWARAARPVVDRLRADLAGTGVRVVLTGAPENPVDRRSADQSPGVRVPITDPNSGRTVGTLVFIAPVTGVSPLMRPLASLAAREVEHRLVDDTGLHERLVLHRFLRRRRGAKGPFVLVTDQRLITNAAADRLVGPDDEPVLREAADRLQAAQDGAVATLVLSGVAVAAQAEQVPDKGPAAGTVLRLTPKDGGTPSRRPYGWESLTDTERSVARLVAEGLTNREAAERLFLSRHTVDFHLRSIFRKLGTNSRVHLARLVVLTQNEEWET